MSSHVFISYSRSDRAYVERLADHLRSAEFDVWYDFRLVAGDQFDEEIAKQVELAGAFVVILTPAAYESRWVARELAHADSHNKPILPLRLEASPTPLRLAGAQQEDVTGGIMPSRDFLARLSFLCKGRLDSSEKASGPPASSGQRSAAISSEVMRRQIAKGEESFRASLIGQDRAVTKILDIVKRAAIGLSIPTRRAVGEPRITMLFVGPFGVGKTEAARKLSELVFGDHGAYHWLDMAEYSSERDTDRLFGSPPGYVGAGDGGDLAAAMQRMNAGVLIFNEIEKAHPRILDKLSQFRAGRPLLDGQGSPMDFTSFIFVYTSQLGIMRTDNRTGEKLVHVGPGLPFDELEARLMQSIRDHFVYELGRAEFVNNIAGKVVVFDFLSHQVAV